MEARLIAQSVADTSRLSVVSRRLARSLAITVFTLLPAVVLLLLMRRVAGAPQQALPPAAMALAAAATWLFGAMGRAAWIATAARPWRIGDWIAWAIPTLALLLLGVSLWLPSTTAPALAAYWIVAILGESAAWTVFGQSAGVLKPRLFALGRGPAQNLDDARGLDSPVSDSDSCSDSGLGLESALGSSSDGDGDGEWPEGLLQQLSRSRLDPQTEVIQGVLRAEFAPSERQQTLHLAFSPPLSAKPRVEAHQAEGPAARIKVADIQTYGVRVDVRLSAASGEAESVWLAFKAVCGPPDAQRELVVPPSGGTPATSD